MSEQLTTPQLASDGVLNGFPAETSERSRIAFERAQTLVAEYARANGCRNPEEVAAFSRRCVSDVLDSAETASPSCLCEHALQRAATVFGLSLESGSAGAAVEFTEVMARSANVRTVKPTRAIQNSEVVPPARARSMPRQPLGELNPLVRPQSWLSTVDSTVSAITLFLTKLGVD